MLLHGRRGEEQSLLDAGIGLLQRRHEPVVAEHRRVDAVGDFPKVPKHLAGLILQLDQLVSGELVSTEPVAGQPQPCDESHNLLLDPIIVQVALNPTSLGVLRGNEADARGGHATPA
jgi:hypothetical protein